MSWHTYKLWRYPIYAHKTSGNIDGRYRATEPMPTTITFRARTEAEAMKKADKFWRFGNFGMGSIFVKKEIETSLVTKGIYSKYKQIKGSLTEKDK